MNPISACRIDIDATITNDRDGARQISGEHPLNNAIFAVLAQFMRERGWEPKAAVDTLRDHYEANVYRDYPDFLEAFDLPRNIIWSDSWLLPG